MKASFSLYRDARKQESRKDSYTCECQTNQYLDQSRVQIHPLQNVRNNIRSIMPIMVAMYTTAMEATVYAAEAQKDPIISGSWQLIRLLQRFAFPVGVGVAIWGAIEYIMDNPGGKERIKKAVVGYMLVFIIPVVFLTLKSAFDQMVQVEF